MGGLVACVTDVVVEAEALELASASDALELDSEGLSFDLLAQSRSMNSSLAITRRLRWTVVGGPTSFLN